MTTLKAFKESMVIGRQCRLVKAEIMRDGVWLPDTQHKAIGLLRSILAKETKNLVFRMLEGSNEGRATYLPWPKAGEFSVEPDGFTIWDASGAGVRLTYKYDNAVNLDNPALDAAERALTPDQQ